MYLQEPTIEPLSKIFDKSFIYNYTKILTIKLYSKSFSSLGKQGLFIKHLIILNLINTLV